jgi:hypothetical protein
MFVRAHRGFPQRSSCFYDAGNGTRAISSLHRFLPDVTAPRNSTRHRLNGERLDS